MGGTFTPSRILCAVIDWLTLRLPTWAVPPEVWDRVRDRAGRVVSVDADGVVQWERLVWETIRSDSHRVHVRAGDCLEIMGSPARAMSDHNVFGSSDLLECASAMVGLVSRTLCIQLPPVGDPWRCTRIDYALNFDLGDAAAVRTALNWMRYAEGGRYRGRSAGTTVYWGVKSSFLSGKAYHKGEHQRHALKRGDCFLTEPQLLLSDRLLRLELAFRRNWLRKLDVWTLKQDFFEAAHADYFRPLIGDCEVRTMDADLLDRLRRLELEPGKRVTEGAALGAFRTAALCAHVGIETASASMSKTTWFRHRKLLLAAGLSLADLRAGHVVPLRAQRVILGAPVRSFSEMRAA